MTGALDEGERRSAFSLIEVLVATALLIMIVSMIGFVFRQSSMAWDSGIRRAEGASQIRAVIGAIERDLRAAVDAREFGLEANRYNKFDNKDLSFIALLEPENGKDDQRVPTWIHYKVSDKVERTASRLTCSNGKWKVPESGESSTLGNVPSVKFSKTDPPDATPGGLPAYVTIYADLVTADVFSGLKVISYGRDGKKGTRDDIVVE